MATMRRVMAMAGGYFAACIVAGAIIAAGIMLASTNPIGDVDLQFLQASVLFVGLTSFFVAVFALIPAALVSSYAERHGKRSALFYCGAGMAIGLASLAAYAALLLQGDFSQERFASMAATGGSLTMIVVVAAVFAMAGAAAGLTYWAIAGRSTGSAPATPVAS